MHMSCGMNIKKYNLTKSQGDTCVHFVSGKFNILHGWAHQQYCYRIMLFQYLLPVSYTHLTLPTKVNV